MAVILKSIMLYFQMSILLLMKMSWVVRKIKENICSNKFKKKKKKNIYIYIYKVLK